MLLIPNSIVTLPLTIKPSMYETSSSGVLTGVIDRFHAFERYACTSHIYHKFQSASRSVNASNPHTFKTPLKIPKAHFSCPKHAIILNKHAINEKTVIGEVKSHQMTVGQTWTIFHAPVSSTLLRTPRKLYYYARLFIVTGQTIWLFKEPRVGGCGSGEE